MVLVTKLIVAFILVMILVSLASAFYYLLIDRHHSDRMIKALSWRIGLSLFLFLLLMIAFTLGWIKPHPLG